MNACACQFAHFMPFLRVLLFLADGEYSADQHDFNGACVSYDPKDTKLSAAQHEARHTNFRVTLANKIMEEYKVPILHIFNTSLVVPEAQDAHPGNRDCRHWNHPSSVLEHWSDLLYNMIVPQDI